MHAEGQSDPDDCFACQVATDEFGDLVRVELLVGLL
jgi:hypothetical protein